MHALRVLSALTVLVLASAAVPVALAAEHQGPYFGTTLVDGDSGSACFTISGSSIKRFTLAGKVIFSSLPIKAGKVSGTAKGVTLKGTFLAGSRLTGTLRLAPGQKANPFFARPRTAVDVKEGRCV